MCIRDRKGLENPSTEFSVPALVLSSNSGTATGKDDFSSGGNWLFAASALANGQGLCYEDYEPFLESGTGNMIVSENKKSVSEYRLNYVMELSSTTQVKRKIMELGAVSASYFAGNGYMNHNNTAYYDPDASKNTIINHSVTVVGWDDNYSKDNFRYKPANNGAWLVKGSWGADQDNDGFYWVSYDEAEFGQFCCYDFEESCDNTYHYSKMTGYVVNASNDGSVYGANVFTAKADEKLDKAGFMYVGKTGSADYTLSVYTNVSDSDPIGVLETQISDSVSANGFYTVDFPEDILLEEGEKYSISVKFSGDSGRGYLLAESDRTSKAQSGQSYVSLNGKYWSDVGADKTIPVLINKGNNFYISETTTATRNPGNKTNEYVAISDHLVSGSDFQNILKKGQEYSTLEAAYNAYEKLLTEGKYVEYKDTLPKS